MMSWRMTSISRRDWKPATRSPILSPTALPSVQEFQKVQDWMVEKGLVGNSTTYDMVVATELYG